MLAIVYVHKWQKISYIISADIVTVLVLVPGIYPGTCTTVGEGYCVCKYDGLNWNTYSEIIYRFVYSDEDFFSNHKKDAEQSGRAEHKSGGVDLHMVPYIPLGVIEGGCRLAVTQCEVCFFQNYFLMYLNRNNTNN